MLRQIISDAPCVPVSPSDQHRSRMTSLLVRDNRDAVKEGIHQPAGSGRIVCLHCLGLAEHDGGIDTRGLPGGTLRTRASPAAPPRPLRDGTATQDCAAARTPATRRRCAPPRQRPAASPNGRSATGTTRRQASNHRNALGANRFRAQPRRAPAHRGRWRAVGRRSRCRAPARRPGQPRAAVSSSGSDPGRHRVVVRGPRCTQQHHRVVARRVGEVEVDTWVVEPLLGHDQQLGDFISALDEPIGDRAAGDRWSWAICSSRGISAPPSIRHVASRRRKRPGVHSRRR